VIAVKDKWNGEYNLVLDGKLKAGKDDILVILGKGKDIAQIKQ